MTMRERNSKRRAFAIANQLCPKCLDIADRLPLVDCSGCAEADKGRETKTGRIKSARQLQSV